MKGGGFERYMCGWVLGLVFWWMWAVCCGMVVYLELVGWKVAWIGMEFGGLARYGCGFCGGGGK